MKLIDECTGKVVGNSPEGVELHENDEVLDDNGIQRIVIEVNEDGSRAVVSCDYNH